MYMFAKLYDLFDLVGAFAAAKLLPMVALAALGILAVQVALKLTKKMLEKSKLEKAAHTLILTAVQVVLYILLALIAASSLGIDVTGVVALASVLTLAVSLSIQNLLANVFGGFTLLYTKPFVSEDYVEIAGQAGTVKEIGLTYTKLATPDNKIVSIPNSAVVAAQIVNYTTLGLRRVDINVSASYNTPAQQVIDTLVAAATEEALVLTEPEKPYAVLMSYGDSTINYTLRFWVKGENYWDGLFTVNNVFGCNFNCFNSCMGDCEVNQYVRFGCF